MTFAPLGDQAMLAYAASEDAALRFAAAVRAANPAWLDDVVPAYASVGIFFDANAIRTGEVLAWLKTVRVGPARALASSRQHTIPICYELGLDLARVSEHTLLDIDTIISQHQATIYTVYAVGFVPGFPYLGYLTPELCGVPRLESPRLKVDAGSVGLTGRQTGIYPLPRPGGWNILGRTPLTIVDLADGFFPIRIGDTVHFERIDDAEFENLSGERLQTQST